MCVAFGAREVYEVIFSRGDAASAADEIDKRAVRSFCQTLEKCITAHSSENPHYEYVFFALDSQSMDSFFEANRDRFLDFGSTVLFVGEHDDDFAASIEQRYDDPVVTNALHAARDSAWEWGAAYA